MGGAPRYFFGHSEEETRRLRVQAELIGGATRKMLVDAEIGPGMRVLDVGTGAGDVALEAATLVGARGSVLGVDANAELVELARRRATAERLGKRRLRGRRHHVVRRAAAARRARRPVRPLLPRRARRAARAPRRIGASRGAIAFQEPGNAALAPATTAPCPTLERMWGWILGTYERAGLDAHMGLRLHRVFLDAGLPAPRMHLDAAAGGAPGWPGFDYMAGLVRTLLPRITALGVAREEEEVDVDTLADRLRAEATATGCAVTTWSFVTAWSTATRTPGARPPAR